MTEETYERNIVDNINAEWRLQNQLRRTELSISDDKLSFSACVELTMNMLPIDVLNGVFDRQKDYTYKPEPDYKWLSFGGIKAGTIENPLLDKDGNVLSPKKIELDIKIDYMKLYRVILEELEKANMSYKYRNKTVILKKVEPHQKIRRPLLIEEEEEE